MTEKEVKVLNRIPKKYRNHIVSLHIEQSGCYNDRGQMLNDYTLMWDNNEEHTFNSQEHMLFMLREYNINGYYVAP